VLSDERLREIAAWAKRRGGFFELEEAVESGEAPGFDIVDLRMVRDGCEPGVPYLYSSSYDNFLSRDQVIEYALESEPDEYE